MYFVIFYVKGQNRLNLSGKTEIFFEALKRYEGNVSKTASKTGINPRTIRRKIKSYGLDHASLNLTTDRNPMSECDNRVTSITIYNNITISNKASFPCFFDLRLSQ